MTSPKLTVEVARRGHAAIVRLTGELGLHTVDEVRSAVLRCLADEPSGLVVELAETTVAAPIALGVFGTLARRAAAWPGVLVVLVVPAGPVRELLRRMALDQVVPTFGSVAEAVRSLGGVLPRQHDSVELPAEVGSAALARRFVTDTCTDWGVGDLAEDACIIASELVENAVLHGHSHARLGLELRRGILTIAVRDDNPERPECRTVGTAPTGGRGVFLVDAIARAWGYAPTWAGGKVVWAVLATTACADNHP
ncbi:STAS domain-containing protein [Kutzneria sp. CA-103260]|uniref:STAS domain-containing protein n=1 Tax=Kutzneria sp. CA-103260 TaxID=2802641 RepID=UPI001BA93248|nr:STAS domain-containing protein [Kutzneria sp. CA-103260]QUQ62983.1 anti-anti-sigma factor [Kutzneria sp. CA-103260]